MPRKFLTDEEVEAEYERLTNTEEVRLARRELRVRYRKRQKLYTLRSYYKRGKELMAQGITMESFDLEDAEMDELESSIQ